VRWGFVLLDGSGKMDEDNNNQNGQPNEEQESTDNQQNEYREISKERLEQILDDHEKWLSSDGKEGRNAELMGYDLRKANFFGRNLRKIFIQSSDLTNQNFTDLNLRESLFLKVNLSGANFYNSDLTGAIFQLSDLSNAVLWRAKVTDANLTDVNLRNSKLISIEGLSTAKIQHSDFRGATGLFGNEFAQTDVTGVKLPEEIADFSSLKRVEETSKIARGVYIIVLLACVYSWMTIISTNDPDLITNSPFSPPPITGAKIPLANFYLYVPIFLVGLFIYFHFYLRKLWHALSDLPAIFQDGKRLDEKAYPWLLNSIVRRHFRLLKSRSYLSHIEEYLIIFLVWWAVPLTIIVFWFRYLTRHDWIVTYFHIFLAFITVVISIFFYRYCAMTFNRSYSKLFNSRQKKVYPCFIFLILFFIILVSYGTINGEMYFRDSPYKIRTIIPKLFITLGYNPFANFKEKIVSNRPIDYYRIPLEKQMESITGANIRKRSLPFADMRSAFLVKSDLRDSELYYANLESANLERANLENANLESANLKQVNLKGANLKNANLQKANLQRANLTDANFQNTNLKVVRNLTIEQLMKAKILYQANLDPELFEQVKKYCPSLLKKPEGEPN
jgi:uncharacterized protein YjbI with pentapeptide repeats